VRGISDACVLGDTVAIVCQESAVDTVIINTTLLLSCCLSLLFIHCILCFFLANYDDDDYDMIECDALLHSVCHKLMDSQNRKLTKTQTKSRIE